MEAKEEAEAKVEAKLKSKAEAESEAESKAEPEVKAEAKAEAKAVAKAEAEVKAEAKVEAKAEVEAEVKAEAKAEAKGKAVLFSFTAAMARTNLSSDASTSLLDTKVQFLITGHLTNRDKAQLVFISFCVTREDMSHRVHKGHLAAFDFICCENVETSI